jgi:hypothetical protein
VGSRCTGSRAKGRLSTMRLSEMYLVNDDEGGQGVPSFLWRNHSAVSHGMETGLMQSTTEDLDPETGINVPRPRIMSTPELAYALMGVPLMTVNAMRSLSNRFDWQLTGKEGAALEKTRDHMLEMWQIAVNAELDAVAPERPRTGGPFAPITQTY